MDHLTLPTRFYIYIFEFRNDGKDGKGPVVRARMPLSVDGESDVAACKFHFESTCLITSAWNKREEITNECWISDAEDIYHRNSYARSLSVSEKLRDQLFFGFNRPSNQTEMGAKIFFFFILGGSIISIPTFYNSSEKKPLSYFVNLCKHAFNFVSN